MLTAPSHDSAAGSFLGFEIRQSARVHDDVLYEKQL